MTMIGGRFPQGVDEVGRTLVTFPTYERAQKAVSTLIAAEVPARDIAIVGLGLRSVERITGKLGYATAARSGAINGVLLGVLFSAILLLGTTDVPVQAFVGVLFVGVAIGMMLSLVTFAFVRRRRAFASVTTVVADQYEVTVAAASFQKARQALAGGVATADGAAPAAEKRSRNKKASEKAAAPTPPTTDPRPTPQAPPQSEEPPRYGERITPPAEPTSDAAVKDEKSTGHDTDRA
ncbi:general stress protein [Microbacterium sp. NPDC076911]|uniref:general stress protein n=1 Tax=Microbacterium sp. NPDC076911 TaxID=3154958 RepID=UPI0034205D8D